MSSHTLHNSSRMLPSAAEENLIKKRAALPRALTYPFSLSEYRASPFSINEEGNAELRRSRAFQTIRRALANCQDSICRFCASHLPSANLSAARWLLHRDITHSLVYPLIHIHKRASLLASRVLCTLNSPDLELAFRGEARGVFSWLQCFIAEEDDWLYTRGCPACIVLYVMQSEPSMRLVLASAKLARAFGGGCKEWIEAEGLPESDCGCGSRNKSVSTPDARGRIEGETKMDSGGRHHPFDQTTGMPVFHFWHQILREAIDADPFWGPEIADEIEERATCMARGVMALIAQSCALEEIVTKIDEEENAGLERTQTSDREQNIRDASPVSENTTPLTQCSGPVSSTSDSVSCGRNRGSPRICFTPYHGHEGEVGIIRQSSVLAERGMKGLGATVAGRRSWLNEVLIGCWTTLVADAAALERNKEYRRVDLKCPRSSIA